MEYQGTKDYLSEILFWGERCLRFVCRKHSQDGWGLLCGTLTLSLTLRSLKVGKTKKNYKSCIKNIEQISIGDK